MNLNPYENNGTSGDGGRKAVRFKIDGDEFSEMTGEAEFQPIGPEDGEAMEMMKDLIRVILIEDFGIRPGVPAFISASSCEACINGRCHLKAGPGHPCTTGCFEGIPKDED